MKQESVGGNNECFDIFRGVQPTLKTDWIKLKRGSQMVMCIWSTFSTKHFKRFKEAKQQKTEAIKATAHVFLGNFKVSLAWLSTNGLIKSILDDKRECESFKYPFYRIVGYDRKT